MGDLQADGGSSLRRPAPLFDPVAGVRAVADIQAEGLRAAGELLDRVLRSEPEPEDRSPRSSGGDVSALLDVWIDLLRRTVDQLARPGTPGAVTVAVDASGVGPPVRLTVSAGGRAGDPAEAEVWLHNGTSSAVGPLALHCARLSDSDGTVLDGARVRFEPGEVTLLPARSSRAVAVSLDATGPLRPGAYRGTIQARGASALWLPLEVVVDPC
jgi:hypothetical protein